MNQESYMTLPVQHLVSESDVLKALIARGLTLEAAQSLVAELNHKCAGRLEAEVDETVGRLVNGQLVTLHRHGDSVELGVVSFPESWEVEASRLNDAGVQAGLQHVQHALLELRDLCRLEWLEAPIEVNRWCAGVEASEALLAMNSWLQFGELLEQHEDAPQSIVEAWLGVTGMALVEGRWASDHGSSARA
jgi:hypothetical protein